MKRRFAAIAGTVSLLAAITAAPAAADPGNGNNCVGSAVSQSAHVIRQEFDMGLGQFFHSFGLNPGDVIQQFKAANCDG